jgi:hypothetical protein
VRTGLVSMTRGSTLAAAARAARPDD